MFCEFAACNGDCLLATTVGGNIPSACSVDGKCLKVDNKDIHCDYYDEHEVKNICDDCPDKKNCVVANIK